MSIELNFDSKNIKILQLSDLHISYPLRTQSERALRLIIEEEKPDFIVFSGDLFHYYHLRPDGEKLVNQFISIIDTYDLKYTYCFGNHDHEINIPEREIFQMLIDKSRNFIGEIGPDEVTFFHENDCQYRAERIGNFLIHFKLKGEHKFDIAMLDSGRYNISGNYGSITHHQLMFFKEQFAQNSLPLFIFFHIPLQANKEYYYRCRTDGVRMEKDCFQPDENGFFELVEDTNREVFMFCGHDHLNNYCLKHKNVTFGLTPGLCYEQLCDDRIRGYRVFSIEDRITTKTKLLQPLIEQQIEGE